MNKKHYLKEKSREQILREGELNQNNHCSRMRNGNVHRSIMFGEK